MGEGGPEIRLPLEEVRWGLDYVPCVQEEGGRRAVQAETEQEGGEDLGEGAQGELVVGEGEEGEGRGRGGGGGGRREGRCLSRGRRGGGGGHGIPEERVVGIRFAR